jgi:hypothetical protein
MLERVDWKFLFLLKQSQDQRNERIVSPIPNQRKRLFRPANSGKKDLLDLPMYGKNDKKDLLVLIHLSPPQRPPLPNLRSRDHLGPTRCGDF